MNNKKTVIVTGGSKGIGADIAIHFAEKGYNVVINYNSSVQSALLLQRSLAQNGYSVIAHKANVTNKLEVELMIKETVYQFGSVDIFVNNAGIAYDGLLTETEDYDIDNLINVNLKGVINCCRAVLPYMIKNKSGKIINISSIWGISGASCESVYSASKAGVIGLTKSLAKEYGPSGITVNCIAPGMIDTQMNANLTVEEVNEFTSKLPISRIGTTSEVADTVLFLASDSANYITGQTIAVDGGLTI